MPIGCTSFLERHFTAAQRNNADYSQILYCDKAVKYRRTFALHQAGYEGGRAHHQHELTFKGRGIALSIFIYFVFRDDEMSYDMGIHARGKKKESKKRGATYKSIFSTIQ